MPPSVPLKTNCRKQTSSPSPSPRCSALGPQRPSRTGPGHRGAGQRPPQRPHSRAPERSPATAGNRPVTHAATWTNLKEITRAENSRAQNEIQSQKLTNSETGAKWLSEGACGISGGDPALGPGEPPDTASRCSECLCLPCSVISSVRKTERQSLLAIAIRLYVKYLGFERNV